jgi:hypothetical protein
MQANSHLGARFYHDARPSVKVGAGSGARHFFEQCKTRNGCFSRLSLVSMGSAVSCVVLTKAVVRAAPSHCTTEPATKPVPVTVSVNAGPPAVVVTSVVLSDRSRSNPMPVTVAVLVMTKPSARSYAAWVTETGIVHVTGSMGAVHYRNMRPLVQGSLVSCVNPFQRQTGLRPASLFSPPPMWCGPSGGTVSRFCQMVWPPDGEFGSSD